MKQDSIAFILSTEHVAVNDTVKVTAHVAATVTPDISESKLRDMIRHVTKSFIDADWQFSGMTRSADQSGVESIRLTATTRVPEAENYALDQRREKASAAPIRIHAVQTDTRPTVEQIAAAHSLMRIKLMEDALNEVGKINNHFATYRLSQVVFNPETESMASNRRPGQLAMAASASMESYGAGFDQPSGGGAIGNAVKLTMNAWVQLRKAQKKD